MYPFLVYPIVLSSAGAGFRLKSIAVAATDPDSALAVAGTYAQQYTPVPTNVADFADPTNLVAIQVTNAQGFVASTATP